MGRFTEVVTASDVGAGAQDFSPLKWNINRSHQYNDDTQLPIYAASKTQLQVASFRILSMGHNEFSVPRLARLMKLLDVCGGDYNSQLNLICMLDMTEINPACMLS